jgi:voltage-gated potassium channel
MAHNPLVWIGLAGVDPDDNARARLWQQRLQWVMVGIALLALPAYVLDTAEQQQHPGWHSLAGVIDAFIFAAFLAETVWMTRTTSFPARYLSENWLNLVILAGALASVLGATTEWIALVRVLRVAIAGLMLVRALTGFGVLFTRRGAPLLVGAAFLILLAGGAMFYWLEPTIESYWDGLWLAFVTGTTIGYGDIVPTTAAARLFAAFMVLVGVSLVTLFTANVVAFFVGREEVQMRRELHREIVHLRRDLARLVDAEEVRMRSELHDELRLLRREIAALRGELARGHVSEGSDDNRNSRVAPYGK